MSQAAVGALGSCDVGSKHGTQRSAALEQIVNPKCHFDVIERLQQKIGCAGSQGAAFGFLIRVCGQDNDRQKNFVGVGPKRPAGMTR